MGGTLGDAIKTFEDVPGQTVIRPRNAPLKKEGGMAILRGNLAPRGAVIKQAAASPKLMQHEGRAVVFEFGRGHDRRASTIPRSTITEDDVIVMRNAGPIGAPGMPEAGYIPIPKKLAQKGIKDMVRISDARMSGTAFGTIVLHVSPESAVGGPLALVQTGDRIRLDVAGRKLELLVSDAELEKRRKAWKAPPVPDEARARLRQALSRARAAGRRRLRLRFSGGGDRKDSGYCVAGACGAAPRAGCAARHRRRCVRARTLRQAAPVAALLHAEFEQALSYRRCRNRASPATGSCHRSPPA